MSSPKITVLFYSTYGTNAAVSRHIAEVAEKAGAEVRLRRVPETAPKDVVEGQDAWKAQLEAMSDIPEATLDDMEWADGYFVSSPTRFGVVASQMRAFFDTLGPLWQKGALADKAFTASTSANTSHGGQEMTFLSLYVTAMHWGCVIVAPGYADGVKFEDNGNPYGFSKQAGELTDLDLRSLTYQTERLVEKTRLLRG